jgi:hypothetical protein
MTGYFQGSGESLELLLVSAECDELLRFSASLRMTREGEAVAF